MSIIYTRRLTLRTIKKSDINDFHEYCSDPNVGPNSGWQPHENKGHSRFILKAQFLHNPFAWGIIYNGKLIGSISLDTDRKRINNRVMMLGYSISSKYWGLGIMSEAAPAVICHAFNTYDIDALSIYCYPQNERSRRIIEKCGFEYEGKLTMAQQRFDGKIMDNLCYIMTLDRFKEIEHALPVYKA